MIRDVDPTGYRGAVAEQAVLGRLATAPATFESGQRMLITEIIFSSQDRLLVTSIPGEPEVGRSGKPSDHLFCFCITLGTRIVMSEKALRVKYVSPPPVSDAPEPVAPSGNLVPLERDVLVRAKSESVDRRMSVWE